MLTIEEITETADLDEVAIMLSANLILGQPLVTADMVLATFTRQAIVDQWFYDELVDVHVLGLRDSQGDLVGIAAYGDSANGVRDLLWMAALNDADLPLLIDSVFDNWSGPARAFSYGSTVSRLAGLPRHHRSAVHDALESRGFTGVDLWSYQMLELKDSASECVIGFTEKHTIIDDAGNEIAEYDVGIPHPDLGVFWWVNVVPECRGRGYGGTAFDAGLHSLATHGARRVILACDDDDTTGPRDRTAALAMYASRGFVEIDRLWSYSRGDLPPDPDPNP